MRNKAVLSALLWLTCIGSFFSCKKESSEVVELPQVFINELGSNNSREAHAGRTLHHDADISAMGKVASIKVQITLAETNYGWDFLQTYTGEYAGMKNVHFHEHIDVPENARAGTYTLLITVTDELGQKAQARLNFEVVRDVSLPTISRLSLRTFSLSTLNLSGELNAPNRILKLVVEIQSPAWTREFIFSDETMVDKTSFHFSRDIDISTAPAGHYHVNLTLSDKSGKKAGYHYHFDK